MLVVNLSANHTFLSSSQLIGCLHAINRFGEVSLHQGYNFMNSLGLCNESLAVIKRQGAIPIERWCLTNLGISIIKIRRFHDRFIFMKGNAVLRTNPITPIFHVYKFIARYAVWVNDNSPCVWDQLSLAVIFQMTLWRYWMLYKSAQKIIDFYTVLTRTYFMLL